MGQRQTGKFARVLLPNADGALITNTALTLAATKTIGGIAYTNRFYGISGAYINKAKDFEFAIQGVLGNVTISPTTSNNQITVSAFSYRKDAGAVIDVAASTPAAVTRPATGKYAWYLVVVDTDDNAVSVVKGTDGDSIIDTWDGNGGPPLVAADKLILGGFTLLSDSAAVVDPSAIRYTLYTATSTLIQERADNPVIFTKPLEGGVLLSSALLACHTGPVARKVYGTFYNFAPNMVPALHLTGWTLGGSQASVSFPACEDTGTEKALAGAPDANGTLQRYSVDSLMFKAVMQRGVGVLQLYRNINESTEYYECAAIFTSFADSAQQDAASVTDVNFEVDGDLEWRGNE